MRLCREKLREIGGPCRPGPLRCRGDRNHHPVPPRPGAAPPGRQVRPHRPGLRRGPRPPQPRPGRPRRHLQAAALLERPPDDARPGRDRADPCRHRRADEPGLYRKSRLQDAARPDRRGPRQTHTGRALLRLPQRQPDRRARQDAARPARDPPRAGRDRAAHLPPLCRRHEHPQHRRPAQPRGHPGAARRALGVQHHQRPPRPPQRHPQQRALPGTPRLRAPEVHPRPRHRQAPGPPGSPLRLGRPGRPGTAHRRRRALGARADPPPGRPGPAPQPGRPLAASLDRPRPVRGLRRRHDDRPGPALRMQRAQGEGGPAAIPAASTPPSSRTARSPSCRAA